MPFSPPLDRSVWIPIHAETSPPGKFNHVVFVDLPIRSDVALVTVATARTDADWVRAGWVQQIWLRGDDEFLIARERLDLNTSLVFEVEPLDRSLITFEPVQWLLDWNIYIEAREYQP